MRLGLKLFFFPFIFFLPLFLQAEKSVLIAIFKNAPLNDRLELQVAHYYIDGGSDTYRALFDERGQAVVEADISEPQYVTLSYRGDYAVLYLEPNDTLVVESDPLQFPLVVNFSGKGGHNNTLLRKFLTENPINFNEFSKLRYKINNLWCTIEAEDEQLMRHNSPEAYKALCDKKQIEKLALLDEYVANNPNKVTNGFVNFLTSEIMYSRAYQLLFYGNIYKVMHNIEPSFFEVLYDVPYNSNSVGSPAYRRYIMAYMAYRSKIDKASDDFSHQYLLASDLLSDKSLAFFRSEVIHNALKEERYEDALPHYTSFLQNNELDEYEEKVTALYQKAVQVMPGTLAPFFEGEAMNGNHVALDKLRGKVVYLNFWAGYCGSCIKKMRFFNEREYELESAGIQVINVSIDELENWHNNVVRYGVRGLNMQRTNKTNTDIAKAYQVQAVPQYFIIAKDGTFASKTVSSKPEDIFARLKELAVK